MTISLVPALTSSQWWTMTWNWKTNTLFPQVTLFGVFYHGNRSETRTCTFILHHHGSKGAQNRQIDFNNCRGCCDSETQTDCMVLKLRNRHMANSILWQPAETREYLGWLLYSKMNTERLGVWDPCTDFKYLRIQKKVHAHTHLNLEQSEKEQLECHHPYHY